MILSITLNPARRNLSVRTHRFCPAVYGGTFNPPPYLFIEFERGPGSGVDQTHYPLMHNGVISVDEASHTNMSKLYD